MTTKCCERDHNGDGNCDIHEAPGVLRNRESRFKGRNELARSGVVARIRPAEAPLDVRTAHESPIATKALTALRSPKRMNKTEQRRARELEAKKRAGLIRDWKFHGLRLEIAPGLTFTPDFYIEENDGSITLEETKGHWEEDARVKIKAAAEAFPPFRFIALTPATKAQGGGWITEYFNPRRREWETQTAAPS
jgi:hypothetical protein